MDILINFLIILILLVGGIACVWYWSWIAKAEEKKQKKKKENTPEKHVVPGSKEATQQSIMNFIRFINPFQNFLYEVKLYVGVLIIILLSFYGIYILVG